MKFVYPDFLFALAALAIPILIHLFNFKKFKRVQFSNVAFLKEIKQESKSKSRLKEWLILLSRLLAITFLVLAFAQPYIPVSDKQRANGDKAVSIYLDNSFSMNGNGDEGRLLDMAKQYIYKIMDSYSAGQKFQLITSDFSGNIYRSYSKETIEEQLAAIGDSPNSIPLEKVLETQEKWLNDENTPVKESYIVGDFQKSTLKNLSLELDTSINYRWISLEQANTNNLFIDSVWTEAPSFGINEDIALYYRIVNTGSTDLNGSKLQLTLNDVTYGNTTVDVASNSSIEGQFIITPTEPGFYKGELKLEDYPIEYDNSWYFSYRVTNSTNLLVLNQNDSSAFLGKIFSPSKQFKTTQVNHTQLNYSLLKSTDVVVLNSTEQISKGLGFEIKSFVKSGGVLCIIPSLSASDNYNELFATLEIGTNVQVDSSNRKANSINYADPFYSDVFEQRDDRIDLPEVFNFISWNAKQLENSTQLITLNNGKPLLHKKQLGKGYVFVWTSNGDNKNSNLSEHSVYLLSLYKIGLTKAALNNLSYTIEPNIKLTSNYAGSTEFLTLKNGQKKFIPEMRNVKSELSIWPHENMTSAGFYELTKKDSVIDLFAVNYSREESNLVFWTDEELTAFAAGKPNLNFLEDNFENFEHSLSELTSGVKYWKWMIVFALLMLLIEILLIKFWRN